MEGRNEREVLILKTEGRNVREMKRDGTLAVLRRETEKKERQQMGYGERERVRVCVLFHCSLWCGNILGGSQRHVVFLFYTEIVYFLLFIISVPTLSAFLPF